MLGANWLGSMKAEKDLRVLVDTKSTWASNVPLWQKMLTAGQHEEKYGQQVNEGGYSPLFSPGKTTSGIQSCASQYKRDMDIMVLSLAERHDDD